MDNGHQGYQLKQVHGQQQFKNRLLILINRLETLSFNGLLQTAVVAILTFM